MHKPKSMAKFMDDMASDCFLTCFGFNVEIHRCAFRIVIFCFLVAPLPDIRGCHAIYAHVGPPLLVCLEANANMSKVIIVLDSPELYVCTLVWASMAGKSSPFFGIV